MRNSTYEGDQEAVVFDDGSDVVFVPPQGAVDVERLDTPSGWIATANRILHRFIFSDHEYLVITNNDVVFLPGWDTAMVSCFESNEDCGIVGPVTNQPGHQQLQLVDASPLSADDLSMFLSYRDTYLKTLGVEGASAPEMRAEFVNGFCFMLKKDRLLRGDHDNLPVMFEGIDGHPHYGGEDLYQFRMRRAGRHSPYIASGSWVYHFKDVSMESHKVGRMGLKLENLPRLKTKGGISGETPPVRDPTDEVEEDVATIE